MTTKLLGRKGQVGDGSLELLEAGASTPGSCVGRGPLKWIERSEDHLLVSAFLGQRRNTVGWKVSRKERH